jgi:isocitrate dehydrogenase kinase/phosphatase
MSKTIDIAQTILTGFDDHFRIFSEITAGAQKRFETANWKAERKYSRLRIQFYDTRVDEAILTLENDYEIQPFAKNNWAKIKSHFILLLQDHPQSELAETFYNSLFCRMFERGFYTNEYIFIRSSVSTEYVYSDVPTYKAYYPTDSGFFKSIENVLNQFSLTLPYENFKRDSKYVARTICKVFKKDKRTAELNFQFQVINALFYRNKAAYIVGKVINGHNEYPFAVALLNNEKGAIYIDALLIGEDSVSQLFGFSYAYFMVSHSVPSAIVYFLQSLMPRRKKEGLYSAIGFQKQGKTDFYRGFLHHLEYSDDDLILAPGIAGMVMSVFTLPSYPYVFKIIRDYFAPPKEISRQQVEEKYQLVKQHDRVGRMADMLEFSKVVLPLDRFTPELLKDLNETCKSSISFIENKAGVKQLMIKHVYIERRMLPLNLELEIAQKDQNHAHIDHLVKSYGNAIKELSAANIFPGDLLYKNFGVTRLGRVVFYDYDEIVYLTDCNFRKKPQPRNHQELMSATPWYSVAPNDIFPEEFASFLLNNEMVKASFMKYHANLFDADTWIEKQENIKKGLYEDVFPYPKKYRLKRNK